jgi:hypothetical protein
MVQKGGVQMKNIRFPVILSLLAGLILMSACAHPEATDRLSGKTKHWEAAVEYHQSENTSEEKLMIRYIGGEAAFVGPVHYQLKSGQKVLSEEKTFLDGNGQAVMNSVLKDISPVEETDRLTLEIRWDQQKEEVLLTK